MARRGRWGLDRIGKARTGRHGMMWLDGDCNGCAGKKTRISRKGDVRNDMESTRMARNSRHGMADAGWRRASGAGRDCSGRHGKAS